MLYDNSKPFSGHGNEQDNTTRPLHDFRFVKDSTQRFQGLGPLSFSHYKSFHLHSSLLGLLRVKTYKYQICKKSPRTIKIPFRFACPKISMLPSRLVFTAQPHFNSFPPASPAHFHHNKWPLSSGGYPIDGFKRQIKQLIYMSCQSWSQFEAKTLHMCNVCE